MNAAATDPIDLIEELRLRRWARANHVPMDDRDLSWPAVILDEMARKDDELEQAHRGRSAAAIAPLGEARPRYRPPHRESGPRFLASPQRSGELYYT